jgi:CHAT domain-containing protein
VHSDERRDGSGCPDSEILAAYLDGTLEPSRAANVEAHVADCPACRLALGEAAAFLAGERSEVPSPAPAPLPSPLPRRRAFVITALAMAAALVLAIRLAPPQWLPWNRTSGTAPELQELIAAVAKEPTRPVIGRLSGGFTYAPPPPVTRGTSREVSPDVRIAAARIEKRAGADASPSATAALGVAFLATGEYEKAVSALEDAAERQPDDAAVLTDLSAAYLARAQPLNRPADWPRALSAAEKAVSRDPGRAEAYFNRALALEGLQLQTESKRAWEEYRQRDPSGPWADEAAVHAARTGGANLDEVKERLEQVLAAGDRDGALRIARQFPDLARNIVRDRLLPAWADAYLSSGSGGVSERWHRLVQAADLVTEVTGDATDRDAAATLSSASDAARRALANAHQQYTDAFLAYRQFAFERAIRGFRSAEPVFARYASPYALLSRAYEATSLYQTNAFEAAERMSGELIPAARVAYPRIAGQAVFLSALIAINRGDYARALDRMDDAQQFFERAAAIEDVANVHTTRAETLRLLGQETAAWTEQLEALSVLPSVFSATRRQAIFYTGGLASEASGLIEAALYFKRGFVDAAAQSGVPAARVEALTHLAMTYLDLGRAGDARATLNQARTLAATLDAEWRDFNVAQLDAVEGRAMVQEKQDAAVDMLARAITYFERSGRLIRLPAALRWKAQAHAAAGDHRAALADAQRGLAVLAENRDRIRDDTARADYAEQSWGLLDTLVTVDPDARKGSALAGIERIRGAAGSAGVVVTAGVPGAAGSIPGGAAVLSYFIGSDAVSLWVATSDGVRYARMPANAGDIERHARRFQHATQVSASDDSRSGRWLSDLLIGPVRDQLQAKDTLIVIADGPLALVPFAALPQPGSERMLVEDFAIGYAESIGEVVRPSRPMTRPLKAALVAAADAVDVDGTPLPRLAGALQEIGSLATLYPGARLVTAPAPGDLFATIAENDVVHFAGHAIADAAAPRASRLLLNDRRDGAVLASSATGKPMRARLLVLAACDTARGRARQAIGSAGSLVRPFLAGGVETVVASQWAVADDSSNLFVEFHRGVLDGVPPVVALREAQLHILRSGASRRPGVDGWAGVQVYGGLRPLVTSYQAKARTR